MTRHWDIFCRIVDNFGDIGVTWRLARQLAAEHGKAVRLWIDDLSAASILIHGLDTAVPAQVVQGVEICRWEDAATAAPAEAVIEAFACELPWAYVEKMVGTRPLWINLEYLSAEPWVADFHAKASRHPTLPLTKYFFFPGFVPDAGGLLREHELLAKRDDFQNSLIAREAFRKKFHIPDVPALKLSLFCYPHAPVIDLLRSLANAPEPSLCLVPQSSIWTAIGKHLGQKLELGNSIHRGNLTLLALPFLPQDDYDRLLWLCDINFVRGEDSWVRAIWAGKPLVWQPYRQQENAHLQKLEAFLNAYTAGLSPAASTVLKQCHENWSSDMFPDWIWQEYLIHQTVLRAHAQAFAEKLAAESDLTCKLVIFCGNPS